jgi:hypothetical protein
MVAIFRPEFEPLSGYGFLNSSICKIESYKCIGVSSGIGTTIAECKMTPRPEWSTRGEKQR